MFANHFGAVTKTAPMMEPCSLLIVKFKSIRRRWSCRRCLSEQCPLRLIRGLTNENVLQNVLLAGDDCRIQGFGLLVRCGFC